jgi:tripeptide aminopeptidase
MSQIPAPDNRRALDLVTRLMAIPGQSGHEQVVADFIIDKLTRAGVMRSAIGFDGAHRRSRYGGQCGNLIVKLPGTSRGPRRMLVAHMDTVPLCVGCKPVRKGGWVRSADGETALGADNRSGVAAVLTAALHLLEHKLPHPPLTLLFPVQEEVGLVGARYVAKGRLGNPKMAFNFDGGSPEKLTIGATGSYRMTITIHGIASHAGVRPENGVSAIAVAGLAIADLQRNGWLGRIAKKQGKGTSNIGIIEGGDAVNVVPNRVTLRAEARSHDKRFRKQVLDQFIQSFETSARRVRNDAGKCASVQIDHHLDYEAFELKHDAPAVREAQAAVADVGGEAILNVCNGGLDANWLSAAGIPTVTLGAGQLNAHTVDEALHIASFHVACRVAVRLATGV